MRMKKSNVERIVETAEQAVRLKKDGFREIGNAVRPVKQEKHNLDEMNVAALRNLAKEKGFESCSSLTKTELLEILKEVV